LNNPRKLGMAREVVAKKNKNRNIQDDRDDHGADDNDNENDILLITTGKG